MNYFNYHKTVPFKAWTLFSGLEGLSDAQRTRMYGNSESSRTLEIIRSAMDGNIALDSESIDRFNICAYEYSCTVNEKKQSISDASTEYHIVDMDSTEKDDKVGYGDYSSLKLKCSDSSLDDVIHNKEYEESLYRLFSVRKKYIIEKGIDVVPLLKSALNGIPEAVSKVKVLIGNDSFLKEVFIDLCENSSGRLIEAL